MDSKFQMPTETVDLPSKGLLYPEDSPLSAGTIEMKYMTAKEEDLLTNTNYIQNGTVIDRLLKALIVTKDVNYNELLIGDKNAIMVGARILSYGKDYDFYYNGEDVVVDLTTLKDKKIDHSLFSERKNEFEFNLPHSDNVVTFKLLTHQDEKQIDAEIAGLKKIDKESNSGVTTRLKRMILSVNGSREIKDIFNFVETYLLAKDARALREYFNNINPDIVMKFIPNGSNDDTEGVDLPINLNFFWPDA